MNRLLTTLAAMSLVLTCTAQNLSIAKDQARRASAATTAASGGGEASAPHGAVSSPSQTQPADPAVTAMLQNVSNLRTDLIAIGKAADAKAATEHRLSLLNNMTAAAQGKKPTAASLKKLAGDLIDGLAGNSKLAANEQKLAQAIRAISNASRLTSAQLESVLKGAKKTLTDAGVSPENIDKIVGDMETIAAETK